MSIQISLMTYNVHSCVGTDKKASTERIAEVIARYGPDIVALQELDVELLRSGMVDQAKEIAGHLNMHFHFHPSFRLEKGYFGNAVLSRFPLRLIRAAELPTFHHRRILEKRGALWVNFSIDGKNINLINTHLGLNRLERKLQTDQLLGPEWTRHPSCTAPVILCGDFNASPLSGVYGRIIKIFIDAQKVAKGRRPRCTWPSRFPFLRIDHVFLSHDMSVENTSVLRTRETETASDHLPLLVHIKYCDKMRPCT